MSQQPDPNYSLSESLSQEALAMHQQLNDPMGFTHHSDPMAMSQHSEPMSLSQQSDSMTLSQQSEHSGLSHTPDSMSISQPPVHHQQIPARSATRK